MKPQVRGCKPLNLMLLAAWVALAGMFVSPAQAGSVDLITREYEDGEVDLSVKVAGGSVDIERVFRDNRWEFDGIDERVDLSRYRAGESGSMLLRNRVEFRRVAGSVEVYESTDKTRITPTAAGFRWSRQNGQWRQYDAEGQLHSYGFRDLTTATVMRNPEGQVIGIADRQGQQVAWIQWNGDRVASVRDHADENQAVQKVNYTYNAQGQLTGATDGAGRSWVYTWTGERMTQKVKPDGVVVNLGYTPKGNIASVTDAQGTGKTYRFSYDKNGKIFYAMVRSTAGEVRESWFDANRNLLESKVNGQVQEKVVRSPRQTVTTDASGAVTVREYNEWDQVTRETAPDGGVTTWAYEQTWHQPVRRVDALGVVTEWTYDTEGNLLTMKEAVGTAQERTTSYQYDQYNRRTHMTDARGFVTRYEYDTKDNLTRVFNAQNANDQVVMTYDARGNLLTRTDALDRTTTYEYDVADRLVKVKDALNQERLIEYNALTQVSALVDALGKRTTLGYDSRGNLHTITDPLGKTVTITHDLTGARVEVTDREGNTTITDKDKGTFPVTTTSPMGQTVIQTLDEVARTVEVQSPFRKSRMTLDALGRPVKTEDVTPGVAGNITQYEYNLRGELVTVTDALGRATRYEYDALGRLTAQIAPDNGREEYTYDAGDNLIKRRNALGQEWVWEYDRHSRPVQETMPMGQERVYEYDLAGQMTGFIDARGKKTVNTFDAVGRITQVRHYATAQAGTAEKTIDWTHNANGQVTGYSDTTTTATYQYDDNGRMVSENVNYGTFALTNSYGYDGNGRVKTYTDPQGIVYTYSYDADGRLTTVNIPGEGQIALSEFKEGRYTRKLLPGNQEQITILDGRLRPIDLKSLRYNEQNPFHQIGYQYNDINRMEARSINTIEKAFAYSVKDELTSVTASEQLLVSSYQYDLNGNRLVSTTTNNQIQNTKNYSFDLNGRLTSDGTFTYTYDAEGNLTEKSSPAETWEYLYNVEGRIIEIKKDNVTVATYQYDPMGRRIFKTVLGSAPVPGAGEGVPPEPVPVTTYYHYNAMGLCGEYNASGHLLKSYGYAPGSGWSTDPLFMKVAPSSSSDIPSPIFYYFHNDALGTPQALTDKSGTIMWTASYDEFGSATISGNGGTSSTSSVTCNLRFPGQYFDAETGLHYNFQRYYDPTLGRYITEDPIRDGLNWYAYASSNPINMIDPLGLDFRLVAEYGSPHLILQIKTSDGNVRSFDWTGLGDVEKISDVPKGILDALFGKDVKGTWRELDSNKLYYLPSRWVETHPCEDSKLIRLLEELIKNENLYYNLYSRNSNQMPIKIIQTALPGRDAEAHSANPWRIGPKIPKPKSKPLKILWNK